jgi:hypothetical protein
MLKKDFLRELWSETARLGWRRKDAARLAHEVSEHWEDLEAEAQESGVSSAAIASFARERIGAPKVLASIHQKTMRTAHWGGRHPVLSFAVLPPVLLVAWFMAWVAMAIGAAGVYAKIFTIAQPVWSSYLVVLIWAKVIHYTGMVAVPAIAWWWAGRSFCGRKWGWIACGTCAVHGLLNHVTIRAHSLHWGYGIAPPDWLPVIAPLMVGVVAHYAGRSQIRMIATTLLLVALTTGCASSRRMQERGWIGGEYKKVTGGLLITRLSTNSPAARSGLREGDVVVRFAGKPANSMRSFRKEIDAAERGSHIPVEIAREGTTVSRDVLIGKEVYKPNRNITAGVLLSREWDLWPNPGFSLIALGYKRQDARLELDSPESCFKLAGRTSAASEGLRSREGWEIWLPVLGFSSRKQILAQSGE